MPFSYPTQGLSKYFKPNWGGVGFGFDYFWSKHRGLVCDAMLYEQSSPTQPFSSGENWVKDHNVILLNLNANYSFLILNSNKPYFYPYTGLGVGWLKTNGIDSFANHNT